MPRATIQATIGSCAGQDCETTLVQRNKRVSSARCNDPAVRTK